MGTVRERPGGETGEGRTVFDVNDELCNHRLTIKIAMRERPGGDVRVWARKRPIGARVGDMCARAVPCDLPFPP